MKHSNFRGVLAWSGGTITLNTGQRFSDDHPLVTERPDLFEDGDTNDGVTEAPKPVVPPTVERATAAPGEVRTTPGTGPRSTSRVPRTPASDQ